jgi:hypothetical protein
MVSQFNKKHGERFEKYGCTVARDDSFYVRCDSYVNRIAELCFFEHLQELALKMKLKPSFKAISELTKTKQEKPRKKYKTIKQILTGIKNNHKYNGGLNPESNSPLRH